MESYSTGELNGNSIGEFSRVTGGAKDQPQAASPNGMTSHEFQFIDLSTRSSQEQKRNRTMARSYVMKRIRGGQRKSNRPGKDSSRQLELLSVEEDEIEMSSSEAALRASRRQNDTAAFATNMAYGIYSATLPPNQRTMIESNYPALRVYQKKPTPYLHMFLDFLLNTIWPLYDPPSLEDASLFCKQRFTMTQTSSALFHSSLYLAAALLDSAHFTNYILHSPEMINHKIEAIRNINLELNREDIPETAILAIFSIGMTKTMEKADSEKQEQTELDRTSPFKRLPMPPGWNQLYRGMAQEEIHFNGIRTIIGLKGGIQKIKNRPIAKALSLFDLNHAALHLTNPYFPFQDHSSIIALLKDPQINMLLEPTDSLCASGFLNLPGLTKEFIAIILDIAYLTSVIEAYSEHNLGNPNFGLLVSRRNAIHHRLLSLPAGSTLNASSSTSLYECCRLAVLLYSVAAVFPTPPSTGCPQQLVLLIKSALEDIHLKDFFGRAGLFYTWVFFLAGIGAERMLVRSWFVDRLRVQASFQNISCWNEMKVVARSFLWMSAVCDEGGMNLWNDIQSSRKS